MSKYIFIESRDPFESRDTQFVEETATMLKRSGHEVTVFLVQNAVLASRASIRDSALTRMSQVGVNLLADDFSLCERGISTTALLREIRPSTIEALVEWLVEQDTKVIWH